MTLLGFLDNFMTLTHVFFLVSYEIVFLQTSSLFLHIYKVHFSGKRLQIGGKQLSGLCLANISLVIIEKAPFSDKSLTTYDVFTFLIWINLSVLQLS